MRTSAGGARCAVGPAISSLGIVRTVDPMTRIPVTSGAVGEVWQLRNGSSPAKVRYSRPVILFTKSNNTFSGYFHPENVMFEIEDEHLSG